MAVHFPKNLSYQARFNAWVSGVCPYCPSTEFTEKKTPTSRTFRCKKCKAKNKFSLPRLLNEEKG